MPTVVAADVSNATTPLLKGDRLPSRFFDSVVPEAPVATIKVVPTEVLKKPEAIKDDIVNWHWHQGSKVVRRRKSP
jgi:hypothetical protein